MIKYGNPDRLVDDTPMVTSSVFSTGDILLERLLVTQGPSSLDANSFGRVLDASVPIIQQDFDDFEVVGVTICPVPTGETVHGRLVMDPGTYVIDIVYRLLNWEAASFNASDHELAASMAFGQTGFQNVMAGRPSVTFLTAILLSPDVGDAYKPAYDLWSTAGALLVQRKGQPPPPTRGNAYLVGLQKSPKTWGKQMSYGLADYPDALEPIFMGSVATPGQPGGGGTTPTFKWPTASGEAPSNQNLLVWALFAVGGAMLARQVWRSFR